MRKQDKIIIWTAYFDSTRTRSDGRRISRRLAVSSPKIRELKEAVEKLGFSYELVSDVSYPKTPWLKKGMLLITKIETKNKMIKKIARHLLKIRSISTTKI